MLSENDLKIITDAMGRIPNMVEQACFLNLWSEHCSYRSSAPLLKTFTTTGEKVIIGPGDDAAIIDIGDGLVLAIGMESHNHPSYVDPFNGASTGVGGIVRDIISMGARPIALLDPLYFGPLNTPKNLYLFEHIIEGISNYGNCIGVPIVRGETFFDETYSGNPLVNVACIGLAHKNNIITAKAQKAGNKIILIGSTTGRDGLGGASFASKDLSESSEAEDKPSIQIGDPFIEKLLIEATLEIVSKGYTKSCRDLGAAGLAGASCEMASKGNLGMYIRADDVILREEGMVPYEILIAESQERMLFEVDPKDVNVVLEIAQKYDLNASVIGELTERLNYTVEFKDKIVADIPIKLLAEGSPTCELPSIEKASVGDSTNIEMPLDLKQTLLDVLSSHNIASKEWIYRQYDHDVQIRTAVGPGDDGAVLKIKDEKGIVLSCGCNPRHTFIDPYEGGKGTLYENAMNIAVKGGKCLALVDCLNFGNPNKPEIYWSLKNAILGLGDGARELNIPVVGGNVSLYNESDEFDTAIIPTPSIAVVGTTSMVSSTPASEFINENDFIILIGETKNECGGSEYYNVTGNKTCGIGPKVPHNAQKIVNAITKIINTKKVTSSHDISMGGIGVALAEMCNNIGAEVDLTNIEKLRDDDILFSESCARALITTKNPESLKYILQDIPHYIIGKVGGNKLKVNLSNNSIEITLEEIKFARESLTRTMT